MKKILISFLVVYTFAIFTEDKRYKDLFEINYTVKPLLSKLTGSSNSVKYLSRISREEEPLPLSIVQRFGYILMLHKCNTARITLHCDDKIYVCSTNELHLREEMDAIKSDIRKSQREAGESLIAGGILHLPQADKLGRNFFVSFKNLQNSSVDPLELHTQVMNMIKNFQIGAQLVEGNIIKITLFEPGNTMTFSDVFPTEEEITQAKLMISEKNKEE